MIYTKGIEVAGARKNEDILQEDGNIRGDIPEGAEDDHPTAGFL